MSATRVSAATCLGCGCTCDDLEVSIADGAIVSVRHACPRARDWFGDGTAPAAVRSAGQPVTLDTALSHAADVLTSARHARVLLAPDLSCEAYGQAVACADVLRARVDVVASDVVEPGVLAIQERGLATATLGEIRNRADALLFWGVDPSASHPRYASRFAPEPRGVDVPLGRQSRSVIAVDVDDARGPADADARVTLRRADESSVLVALAALMGGMRGQPCEHEKPVWSTAGTLATLLQPARYVALVATLERGDDTMSPDASRIHRLLALSHALNVSRRGALSLLRRGGNLSGTETVLVRHTGYPLAVTFEDGVPRYRPGYAPPARIPTLIVGRTDELNPAERTSLDPATTIVVGPHASHGPLEAAAVTIDTGVAGIHSPGTVVRMDDVALPAKMLVAGPPDAAAVCAGLRAALEKVRP